VRGDARVVTGSYQGSAAAVTRDARRALRALRRDRLDVFLLFWTRDLARLSPDVHEALAALKREGVVGAIGFSTHDRDLAQQAIGTGRWDVVMTRHSAAHPGAEDTVLPAARAAGVGVITFSALSYGRLLRPAPGDAPDAWRPTPAQCYRYGMDRPGVTACVAAPRRARELAQNLEALAMAPLDGDVTAALRAHGRRVREANRAFNDLLRAPAAGALYPAASLPAMLLDETRDAVA
jgi:aryl-alcohol dehydrogenase-like predicted oxidoreductase